MGFEVESEWRIVRTNELTWAVTNCRHRWFMGEKCLFWVIYDGR